MKLDLKETGFNLIPENLADAFWIERVFEITPEDDAQSSNIEYKLLSSCQTLKRIGCHYDKRSTNLRIARFLQVSAIIKEPR